MLHLNLQPLQHVLPLMVWFHNGAKSADNCVAQNGQLGEVATAVVLYVWQRLRASLYQGGVTKLFR